VDEEECVMRDLQGVADTLFIPLVARIHVSRRFPEYFYDEKALSLENFVPGDGIRRSSSEYMYLASVARYRNLDRIVREFAGRNGECNVVNLGAGLETAAFRLADCGARQWARRSVRWGLLRWMCPAGFRETIQGRKTRLEWSVS